MAKQSAGILVYRQSNEQEQLEVLLVHPGGPFWAKKDKNAWSIPKGEFTPDEDALAAAKREFNEEIGQTLPDTAAPEFLGEFKQPSGKVVHAWILKGDFDVTTINSCLFKMEWPPRSGKLQEFPECDRAEWLTIGLARQKLVKGQVPILEALLDHLNISDADTPEAPEQASLF